MGKWASVSPPPPPPGRAIWFPPRAQCPWPCGVGSFQILHQVSAAALKKVSPALRVGGPATDGPAVWLADFIQFCRRTGTPFDFVSSHLYTAYSAAGLGNVSAVAEGVRQGREAIGDERVPWLITEFGASCAQGFGQRYGPSRCWWAGEGPGPVPRDKVHSH